MDLLTKGKSPANAQRLWCGRTDESNYKKPEVDAIKKYVEDGGRAFFMLDPPLKIGRGAVSPEQAMF